ncbi:MAG TPA: glycoside hydrolase family 13 protein [Aggregatilineales bacterium]|nr:alpha-amylase [Anaerolineales bacterium]HRE46722.1 glycoside hydrolase family 13 protein [Aggregatilineales bacterium]
MAAVNPQASTNGMDAVFVSMSDFIFGTLATDDLRLASLRQAAAGLLHDQTILPRDPKPQQPLTIHASAGPDAAVNDVFIHYTTDGSLPEIGGGTTRTVAAMRAGTTWDTFLWGYVRHYSGEIPGQPEGTILRYRLSGVTADGQRLWAQDSMKRGVFSVAVDRYRVPAWVQDAVIYHIFVDRFAPSYGREFASPQKLDGFFGGTLRGITEHLDYLADLGVNTLWLSPLMPSPSHHGYDSTNFRGIEPRYGTKSDLKALISEIHRRGMRILLDFVPNHTSNTHPFFESALANPESPYASYYTFTNHPDEYDTFFGVKTLPKLNNDSPAARRYVIESAVYWLEEFGIDGFRLDHAQGPSHDFWTDYYTAVKKANPDSLHFGEIVEPPTTLLSYEGVLDGVLDFNALQMIRRLFAYGSLDAAGFEQFQAAHENFFTGKNFSRFSFLDNHDMNRFLWAAQGDTRRLKQAAVCQFTLGATPIVYYGTEVGLSQQRDIRQGDFGILEESRLPMIWDATKRDNDLLAFYKMLIGLRKKSTALRMGTRSAFCVDPATGRYGFLRRGGSETILVAFNVSDEPQVIDLPSVTWVDAFSEAQVSRRATIEPRGFLLAKQAENQGKKTDSQTTKQV